MKQFVLIFAALAALTMSGCTGASAEQNAKNIQTDTVDVYFTRDLSADGLLRIYKALGVEPEGRVAIKISTGESEQTGYLRPDFIAPLVKHVGGTLVECNTAYPGARYDTESHLRAIAERGFNRVAPIDILDSEGSMEIPMIDTTWIRSDLVGAHLANYDFLINLAHFKGHQMGGFGGVLKNQSIGIASREGKSRIHSVGASDNPEHAFDNEKGQDAFLETMAGAAQAVHEYMKGRVVYINVMNNMSVDCDCNAHPATPQMKDIGIVASLDPVAADCAALDMVFNHVASEGDDNGPLVERIRSRHGTHIVDYAEQLGLGTTCYRLIEIP